MAEVAPNYYDIPEVVLTYKTKFRASDRPQIKCIEESHDLFRQVWDDSKLDLVEEAKMLLLNQANRVIGVCNLSVGGITGTIVDVRHVLAAALKANANQIILAHNHPSDNLSPSHSDRILTDKIKTAGEYHDIRLLDHLIICCSGCYSLMSEEKYSLPTAKIIPFPQSI